MIEFLTGMFGGRLIEIAAVFLGIANITLLIRRSVWNYPFGLCMVCLYAIIFYEARLYSDMLLQGFFFALQAYGWWYWLQGLPDDGHIVVRRLPKKLVMLSAALAIVGITLMGTLMRTYTDADLPYWDATTTVLSMLAQWMLAQRYLENWLLWIVVDVLAIGIYAFKGLYPTMVLYSLFLVMAAGGYISWYRSGVRQ